MLSSTGFFGAENVVMELLKELKKEGAETFLGILENNSDAHSLIAGEAEKYVDNVRVFPCRGKFDIKSILELRKFIEEHGIDIIHSHKYKTNFYSLLASLPKKTPLISTCHNWLGEDYKMRMYEWLDKKILNKFYRVVAVSDEVKDRILKSGIQDHKVLKIRNGVSIERYSDHDAGKVFRTEFGIDESMIVVGNVGRLDENKGITYLLKAAKLLLEEFSNLLFLIVGEGPSRQELYDESERLGIGDKVIFTGFRNDIPSVLSAIDIFVLPSLIEGLPMILLEAMAAKKPVIATRVGDIPNVIRNNESGLLVGPREVVQLKDAIKYLIENVDHSGLIAEKGLEKVKEEYSSGQMARQYMDVYNDVLQARAQTTG